MIYFWSDTHFFHKNICKYSNRPFSSVEEMNEILIQNCNKIVKPNDEIYHLGDFAFASLEKIYDITKRLNGIKRLILGNHDQEIWKNYNALIGAPYFSSIKHYDEINFNKQKIILFHYGMRVWSSSHHGSIQLHGHSHGSLPPYGKSVDIGVDAPFVIPRFTYMEATLEQELKRRQEDYRPIHIDEVIEYMKDRDITKPDHHNARY